MKPKRKRGRPRHRLHGWFISRNKHVAPRWVLSEPDADIVVYSRGGDRHYCMTRRAFLRWIAQHKAKLTRRDAPEIHL